MLYSDRISQVVWRHQIMSIDPKRSRKYTNAEVARKINATFVSGSSQ